MCTKGSVLGSPLFNLFINDVADVLSTRKLLYVDDLKIFHQIGSEEDASFLQSNLDQFSKRCIIDNKLKLNLNKCYIVIYTRRQIPISYDYSITDTYLNRKQSLRDLGVIFDVKLTFVPHI